MSGAAYWDGLTTAHEWDDGVLTMYVDVGPQPPDASVAVSYDTDEDVLDVVTVASDDRKRYRVNVKTEDNLAPQTYTHNNGVVSVFFENADDPADALD